MDKYKAIFTDLAEGVYGVSPVFDPANESMAVFLNKDEAVEIKLSSVESEKRLMTGIVLIPNQQITRLNKKTGDEYSIEFEADVIRQLSQEFFKKGNHTNAWINHKADKKINGFTFVESWIVEDPANDKANALGLSNLVKGTWVMSAHIEDDDVWQLAKEGQLRGFSIDSILMFEKIEASLQNNNKEIKKEKMGLLKKLINLFSEEKIDIQLETIETEYGKLICDSLTEGSIVYNEDMSPAANVEFTKDGKNYKTDASGSITSITDSADDELKKEEDEYADVKLSEEGNTEEADVNTDVDSTEEGENTEDAESTESGEETELSTEKCGECDGEGCDKCKGTETDLSNEVEVDAKDTIIETQKLSIESYTKQLETVLLENEALKSRVAELSKEPATTKLKSNVISTTRKPETTLEAIARINASRSK